MKISESGKSKKKWLIVALAIVLVIGIFAAIGVMNGSQEEPVSYTHLQVPAQISAG